MFAVFGRERTRVKQKEDGSLFYETLKFVLARLLYLSIELWDVFEDSGFTGRKCAIILAASIYIEYFP